MAAVQLKSFRCGARQGGTHNRVHVIGRTGRASFVDLSPLSFRHHHRGFNFGPSSSSGRHGRTTPRLGNVNMHCIVSPSPSGSGSTDCVQTTAIALPSLGKWGLGIRNDMQRRWRLSSYGKDITEGLGLKCLAAVTFMYFACLAPVVAFGALTGIVTAGELGVSHFVISASMCGIMYHIFSGQPMTMIGPTGLTFAYVSALYAACEAYSWPFLSIYAWTGLWTSAMLLVLAGLGACDLIGYCTRFTDDIFNALIAVTFLSEAVRSLIKPFSHAAQDLTVPFMSLTLALITYYMSFSLSKLRQTKYLKRSIREFLSDFGPALAIGSATLVAQLPEFQRLNLECLRISSNGFNIGRSWIVPFWEAPSWVPLASLIPAILLTMLFYLDQNITSRVVNAPSNKLKRGAAYHLDLAIVAVLVGACSVLGLPWMVACTVQSLNHVRALADIRLKKEESSTPKERILSVRENRLTGLTVHLLIGATMYASSLLGSIPTAVISGLFLYLGRKVMTGNEFLYRLRIFFTDPDLYAPESYVTRISFRTTLVYTAFQAVMLALLLLIKATPKMSLFFPLMILVLILVRQTIAPLLFSEEALQALDEGETVRAVEDDAVMDEAVSDSSGVLWWSNSRLG